MRNKLSSEVKYILFFSFILFTLGFNSAFALSPIPPRPNCEISGVIKAVKIEESSETEEALEEASGQAIYLGGSRIISPFHPHPAGYYLEIEINSVSYIDGPTTHSTCEDRYTINKNSTIFIEKDKVKNGDIFSVNQKISGIIDGDATAFNSSYILIKNDKKQPDPKPKEETKKNIIETYEISKKLINEKYAHKINNIWLQPEQQVYKVEVSKRGKIFLFIPINFNFEIIVDAKTGEINSIKKQWWMSLFNF